MQQRPPEPSSPSVLRARDEMEAWTYKKLMDADAVYVAGGTLLRTQWESGETSIPRHLIDVSSIPGLTGIEKLESGLVVGAATTLGRCRRDPRIARYFPALAEALRAIASPSVRNLATLGGNIVSRVGDSLPALMVYRAELEWNTGFSPMIEEATEWAERLQDQMPKASHLLVRVHLPIAMPSEAVPRRIESYRKVGRREAFVPSLVTVALSAGARADGRIADIAIAAGGGRTIPHRLRAAERLLKGQRVGGELLREVHQAAMKGYKPAPDPFATEAYRKQTAANLIVAELWERLGAGGREGEEE